MKSKSQGLKYNFTIVILLVFCLENIALNWHKWGTPSFQKTEKLERMMAESGDETDQYLLDIYKWQDEKLTKEKAVSVYLVVPYLLLGLFFFRTKFKPDNYDEALIVVCVASVIVNARDHILNNNSRPDFLDWQVFMLVFFLLVVSKRLRLFG